MRRSVSQAADWIDDRTGLLTATSHFLLEEIPQSSGWPQVFGSVALFLLLIQSLTGMALALDYAPATGEAYRSVHYIIHDIAGGRIIHGLHHWGASAMVVVVFAHMAQVFLFGAYKKPREATWIAGVFLLLLTLAFGLTGYLLPWDNKAYWGTMVTVQIVSGLPAIGPLLRSLIGADHGVGVITFSRFYALHTFLLPAATVLLTAIHVNLVRRHGITPGYGDFGKTQRFFPQQLFRDFCAVFLAFLLLGTLVVLVDAPLEGIADPTDPTYVPRPEWYFLFLFELLKLFPGTLEVIGTFVLPTSAVLLLLALPFLRKTQKNFLNGRLVPASLLVLAFAGWAGLTIVGGWSEIMSQTMKQNVPPAAKEWAQIPASQIVGLGQFRSQHCDSCHDLERGTPRPGPTLGSAPIKHSRDWVLSHFNQQAKSDLDERQAEPLYDFVFNLSPESVRISRDITPQFIHGAQIYMQGACGSCHKAAGVGGEIGPSLNGLATRRSETWVKAHFVSPRRLSPGSTMPAFHFNQNDERDLLKYLFSLPN